jgi:hypothetical protein
MERSEVVAKAKAVAASAVSGYFETIVRDIVGRFTKYGSLSEKQFEYLETLLGKIAARDAEASAAADCPEGRVTVEGVVLKTELRPGFRNRGEWKMLVKADAGYRIWSSMPAEYYRYRTPVVKGDRVKFVATVTRSKDDPKFGFAKRPAAVIEKKELALAEVA